MDRKVVLLDRNQFMPDDVTHLVDLGFDYIFTDSIDSVRMIPTQEDRRFTAAVAAMQGMLGDPNVNAHGDNFDGFAAMVAKQSLCIADALLKELAS